jgi:hypothetical protein
MEKIINGFEYLIEKIGLPILCLFVVFIFACILNTCDREPQMSDFKPIGEKHAIIHDTIKTIEYRVDTNKKKVKKWKHQKERIKYDTIYVNSVDTLYINLIKCDSVANIQDSIISKQDTIITDQATIIELQKEIEKDNKKENRKLKRKLLFTKVGAVLIVVGIITLTLL